MMGDIAMDTGEFAPLPVAPAPVAPAPVPPPAPR